KRRRVPEVDPTTADADPETFLSNFMAARAWIAPSGPGFAPLDEDDSADDAAADEFETAFNLRFEDPGKSNEVLMSYQRGLGGAVRREEATGRKRARERERELKEARKREREDDRARLRRLKIEEVEDKVRRIGEAAGLRGKEVDLAEWQGVVDGDFDDEEWEVEMRKRFGEAYYEAEEGDEAGQE
ncbi:Kinetochore protein Spc24, partial [Teratosphaeriaceae sp. CCFEE 6253]